MRPDLQQLVAAIVAEVERTAITWAARLHAVEAEYGPGSLQVVKEKTVLAVTARVLAQLQPRLGIVAERVLSELIAQALASLATTVGNDRCADCGGSGAGHVRWCRCERARRARA